MMKLAHYIEMRVFAKDNESEAVDKAIHELIPFDFAKEKIEHKTQTTETSDGGSMKIITVFVKKGRHTSRVLENLFSRLDTEQKDLLRSQLNSRLDDSLDFYIRLDKARLLAGEYVVTDAGDCFHLKISIAAYPHKRAIAREIVLRLLDQHKG